MIIITTGATYWVAVSIGESWLLWWHTANHWIRLYNSIIQKNSCFVNPGQLVQAVSHTQKKTHK